MPDLVFTSKGSAEALRQQTLINERASEMAQIYKDDARAARELETAVGRIFKSVKDPSKAFNEEMGKVLRNFKDGKINAEQYDKAIKRLETAYKDANSFGGKLRGTLQNMFGAENLKMLQNYALGFTGAGGLIAAVALLKSEYQAVIDLQDKATQTKLDISQARNLVIRNMLGESPATIQKTLAQTASLAGELKLPETVIAQALAEALSASGGQAKDAFAAVRLAGQFLPDQPSEVGQFAGSLIDLQKATGNADPRVNFGLLAKIGQLSRVATPQAIAQNAPKALIGATGFGATSQEAAALFSTLTSFFDPEGRSAATAQGQLAKQLFFFGDNLRKVGREGDASRLDGLTMGQRIAFLQQNPELANLFLRGQEGPGGFAGASFETQFVSPIRGLLLQPDSLAAQSLRQNMASIPDDAGLAALSGQALSNFQLNPLNSQAQTERAIQSFRDNLRLRQPDVLSAEARASLLEVQQNLGGTNVGSRLQQLFAQAGDGSIGLSASDSVGILESERERLLKGRVSVSSAGVGAPGITSYSPATVEDKENAKLLGELIDVLKQQVEQAKETNRKLEQSGVPVTNN